MTGNTAVIAITRHGIDIANRIMEKMPEVQVYAPIKYANPSMSNMNWFKETNFSVDSKPVQKK